VEKTAPLCDTNQTQLENDFCSYSKQLSVTCQAQTECRQKHITFRDATHRDVAANEAARKADHITSEMVLCYFKVFESNNTNKSATLRGCEQLVVNTSQLSISYPAIPVAKDCDVEENQPCNQEWLSAEYDTKQWKDKVTMRDCRPCPAPIPAPTPPPTQAPPATSWRLFTASTVRRDKGSKNCWDVNMVQFFTSNGCSGDAVEVSSANQFSSGDADTEHYKLDHAFDGSTSTYWGGRSMDGDYGSSVIFIGARDVGGFGCIKLTQGDTSDNDCRPSETVQVQTSADSGATWGTVSEITGWSTTNDGPTEFTNLEAVCAPFLVTSGMPSTSCPANGGRLAVETECVKISQVGRKNVVAIMPQTESDRPSGCWAQLSNGMVFFNKNVQSQQECSEGRPCVCCTA